MKHIGTFVVNERAILGGRIQPIGKHERAIFAGRPNLLVTASISLDLSKVIGATETMFFVGGSHEVCHTFVEPEVIPFASCHHDVPQLCASLCTGNPIACLVCKSLRP